MQTNPTKWYLSYFDWKVFRVESFSRVYFRSKHTLNHLFFAISMLRLEISKIIENWKENWKIRFSFCSSILKSSRQSLIFKRQYRYPSYQLKPWNWHELNWWMILNMQSRLKQFFLSKRVLAQNWVEIFFFSLFEKWANTIVLNLEWVKFILQVKFTLQMLPFDSALLYNNW